MAEITGNLPEKGEARSASDGKIRTLLSSAKEVVNGKLNHSNLEAAAGIERAQLAADAKRFTWYTPKVIATEESRENTEFGFLTTEDKIESVVLAENGLIVVGYRAQIKSSASAAGKVAIFLGSNQLKAGGTSTTTAAEASTEGTVFRSFYTYSGGLIRAAGSGENPVTTGQTLGLESSGGLCYIEAAAGTYTVGVKYKASSGSVTAKNRAFRVWTLG